VSSLWAPTADTTPLWTATFDQDVGFGDSAKVEAALAHGLWVTSDLIQSVLRG